MTFPDIIAALVIPLVWGANLTVIKTAVAEFPPLFLIGMRFLAVSLVLIWWYPIPRGKFFLIVLLGLFFGGLHFGSIFFGLQGVDASLVAILSMVGVPFSVIFARIVLKERFGRQQSIGMLIAFAGVLILLGEPRMIASPVHLIWVVIGVVAWGIGNTIIKMIGPINPFSLNAWMGLVASIPLLMTSAFLEEGQAASLGNASATAWFCFLFLVFVTTITAYGLWYHLIAKYDVSKIVPYTLLVPVAGVGVGVACLDEPLTLVKIIGGLITLGGIALVQFPLPRRRSARP